jgi:type I restriction enzyme S subunit
MKPSGVEWMGEVPEGWGSTVFKRVTSRIVVGIAEAATGSYIDKGVPIIRATNIKDGKISGEIIQIEPDFAEKNESKTIKAFDIVTVRTGYPGQSAVLPKELDGSQCFTMLISTLSENQSPFFYNYYINSHLGKEYFGLTAWGSAQKNISVPILQELPIPILSFEEQKEITAYLDQKTAQIDTAISGIRQEIALLQEYRQALIFEAVTGKIDVRENTQNGRP